MAGNVPGFLALSTPLKVLLRSSSVQGLGLCLLLTGILHPFQHCHGVGLGQQVRVSSAC